MANPEEPVPNEHLRRARSLNGWSQAELAERVGTSFEMVSRWERGITIPSSYYRERLCAALCKTNEELGFIREYTSPFTTPPAPLVFLASSHMDAEKPIVAHLKVTLQNRGITLWSSRRVGKQGTTALREIIRTAQAIAVIISPEARSSRHVQVALELAQTYQRPVCGIWIEGEHLEQCLPEDHVALTALIDTREKDDSATIEEIVIALEAERKPPLSHSLEPTNGTRPITQPLFPASPAIRKRKALSRTRVGFLIGLAVLVSIGGLLGGFSLLVRVATLNAHHGPGILTPIHGGTWTYGLPGDANSLIPNGANDEASTVIDQALYLPLFYSDAQGIVHADAATTVPTVQNGGVNADASTWTFHMRPHLLWSDGAPYDARDVDYSWRLWSNPKFVAGYSVGLNLIGSAQVSADYLSITFHLTHPFAPFIYLWVDGLFSPLPAHHFSTMAPDQVFKSPDNLNPKVTSGPFMMSQSVPGDSYTVVPNPTYYHARDGLPYLSRIVFRIVDSFTAGLKKLQAGSIDATGLIQDIPNYDVMRHFKDYTIIYPAGQIIFEALYFNFHNPVLANYSEVRQAMAMAVDQSSIIANALHGLGTPLCTDHSSAFHPGYDPGAPCPVFSLSVANKLLDDNGWVRGADGVRTQGKERLEFEYSTAANQPWRPTIQAIIQHDFAQIGIKLDIQNYPQSLFFNSFLSAGKASPATGAMAGKYDIAEYNDSLYYDPDDSSLFACDQFPPVGINYNFYCNPALDKLFEQEQATADPGVRQEIFRQIHQIYLTQLPFIVLYDLTQFAMVHKGTHNYLPGPFVDTYNIAEWWCDQGKC